ncbi:MAG: NADP-dependent phosphogluconate dehydrogenase [Alphaproteobacteria bacterium]|nr:NADP-dependent phosphogluconate dehydrogenase [Alphaproteobacteria bacterium]MCB9696779.1 NADP-dependent phosphogluconate dehydrogenase [Alphaproteobacteria bacterium]
MSGNADIAVIGLGVMGANLARNFRSRGLTVAVHNRRTEVTEHLLAEHGAEGFVACTTPEELVAALKTPRVVVLMVTAGQAVDAVIASIGEHLEPGDILVDGGNSHYADTERRSVAAAAHDLLYVGMGVSGGEEGALLGPSMMPGGDTRAWPVIRPLMEKAAAVGQGTCVAWCGRGGAGHYTKMVHNGIEYGDMQLLGEVFTLMRDGLGMDAPAQAEVFEGWNRGRLSSFLVEITAGIVASRDPQGAGPLVDAILDEAGQKGTGRWTSVQAVEAGVPLPTITAAVDARAISSRRAQRTAARAVLPRGVARIPELAVEDLEQALYAAKLASYAQGFDLLRTASEERGYGIDLGEVARIWTAGCIIRAAFLGRVREAFQRDPELPSLVLDPSFAEELATALPAWRRVVAAAVIAGIPVPALSASLAWIDQVRGERGAAQLIQAQRDWFGAHTYRRLDAPDAPIHTDWASLERLHR